MGEDKRIFDLKKLTRALYTLDYPYDYCLDELLEGGVDGIWSLARFVQKKNRLTKPPRIDTDGTACTTAHAVTKDGHHILGRNFDYIDGPCLVLRCAPRDGYRSIAVTTMNVMLYGYKSEIDAKNEKRLFLAPYGCMDGINEKGFAIAVLELRAKATHQKTGRIPITTTVIIRAALDKCATVAEAIELFERYDMQASLGYDYHYHMTDASGDCALIEYVDGKMQVLRGQQYAMNFYVAEGGDNSKELGREREKIVAARLCETGGSMEHGEMMSMLNECKLYYRHKRGYMISCLWSAVYDCTDASMLLCAGMDYDTEYRFEQL